MFLRLLAYCLNNPLLHHAYTLCLIIILFPWLIFCFSFLARTSGISLVRVSAAFEALPHVKCFTSSAFLCSLRLLSPVLLSEACFEGLPGRGVVGVDTRSPCVTVQCSDPLKMNSDTKDDALFKEVPLNGTAWYSVQYF